MRFDWYQGTVRIDDVSGPRGGVLVDALGSALGAVHDDVGPGRWGYGEEAILRDAEGDVLVRVLHGGRQGWPSVQGSGEAAVRVAEALRKDWPHWVTRVDVADDRDAPGAWDDLYAVLIGMADERSLAVSQAGDWHRGVDGRTLYVGSRKSDVFVRLYEKGLQLRGQGASPTWVRNELECRPSKLVRERVASMTPEEVWGLSAWTRDLLERVQAVQVPRVAMAEWRPGDDARALSHMLKQYRGPLGRLRDRLGSDEAFTEYLLRRIEAA